MDPRFEPRPIEPGISPGAAAHGSKPGPLRLLRALWLLYVRPDLFVREFVMAPAPWVVAAFAWSYGFGREDFRGRAATILDNWVLQWGYWALAGIVFGFLYYKLGGWWFRKRLSWSGATGINRDLAKRIYLSTAQIEVLPNIAWRLWQTVLHTSPKFAAAAEANNWLAFVLLSFVFPLWSAWASCLGVETAFAVRRGAARFWFFILPLIIYGLATLIVFGAVLWTR